MKTKTAFDWLS